MRRIVNLTNGCRYRVRKADRLVEQCLVAWVERGVSVRSLNVAEMVAARSEAARLREALPWAELPGLRYELESNPGCVARERWLARDAEYLVAEVAA